jgi:hypothetical protein
MNLFIRMYRIKEKIYLFIFTKVIWNISAWTLYGQELGNLQTNE